MANIHLFFIFMTHDLHNFPFLPCYCCFYCNFYDGRVCKKGCEVKYLIELQLIQVLLSLISNLLMFFVVLVRTFVAWTSGHFDL
jgi:hypothetical protein